MQTSFPSSSAEGLKDRDAVSRNEFGKSRTYITKCSTGGIASGVEEDDFELLETKGMGQSAGILVKTEMTVHEEVGLGN